MKDELVQLLLSGDRRVFRKFYRETRGKLVEYARKRVENGKDAEELVQDTYLNFLDSLPLFRGTSSLETFLFSILRHEIADYWRKRYAKKAIRTVPFVDQVYTERLYSAKRMSRVIEQVFARLKPLEAKLLRLKYEEELSVREMADKLGMSRSAVESRLFRARIAFQLAYGELE
jgi:RNA polymerase sigma-70 factor (ECF subfamily)